VRVAAIQLNANGDTDRNLTTADRLVREAASSGAELVALPEKWTVLGTRQDMAAGAETLDGRAISWARKTAAELGIDFVVGSIFERVEGRELGANTSVHIGPDGELKAVYRKIHLFDVEIDGARYAESATEQPGDQIVVSELRDGTKLGLTVCYDVRFPELYRILTLSGARIITVPAAFTYPTTRDHWETLIRARAIENQCFVIAPNQIGHHPGGLRSGGRSMIVDPWGVVLAQATDHETAIVAELELDRIDEVREQIPALTHRRPQAYQWDVV
jgi:deaminated glutathione amidase